MPKIIHDARVWSRRLQQAIDALFAKPRSAKVRRLRRTPRRIRCALGEWRNCDVLIEIVTPRAATHAQRNQAASLGLCPRIPVTETRKRSRPSVEETAARGPGRLRRPSRKVAADKLAEESPDVLMQRLGDSVQEARIAWQASLSRARETRAAGDLHGLRIATKVLRYRTELLYDLGAKHLQAEA